MLTPLLVGALDAANRRNEKIDEQLRCSPEIQSYILYTIRERVN
jgi:hypothetical protein